MPSHKSKMDSIFFAKPKLQRWPTDENIDDLLTDENPFAEEGETSTPHPTSEPTTREDTERVRRVSFPEDEPREVPSLHEQFDELLDLLTRLTLSIETISQQTWIVSRGSEITHTQDDGKATSLMESMDTRK